MSRRGSRHNESSGSEFILECKAAYLSIFDDIEDKIESKKRLNVVLQQTGRNPKKSALDKYWPYGKTELFFDDFVEICRKEPVTSADDLMKAFRKIDSNGDGYISLDELYKIMNKQGDTMSREEVRKMIDEVDENKDGKLDYGEFTNMIMKTTEDSRKFSMKVMEKKERKKKRTAERLRNAAEQESLTAKLKIDKEETESDNEVEHGLKTEDDGQHLRSRLSLRSESQKEANRSINSSKVSLKSVAEDSQKGFGSRTTLRSQVREENMGSNVSLRSLKGESHDSRSDKSPLADQNETGSHVTLLSNASKRPNMTDTNMGSRTTLKSQHDTDMGSKVSLRSHQDKTMGSKASLRSYQHDHTTDFKLGPKSTDTDTETFGSQTSLRSMNAPSRNKEGTESTWQRRESHNSQRSPRLDEHSSSEFKSKEAKSSPRRDSVVSRDSSKMESSQKDPSAKATLRKESIGMNDKPPKPSTPKTPKTPHADARKMSKTDVSEKKEESWEPPESPRDKPGTSKDSARTVAEEIIEDDDDDFDVVTTARPTPRVDLSSPKNSSSRTQKKEGTESVPKDNKGNLGHALGSNNSAHAVASGDGKNKSRERKETEEHSIAEYDAMKRSSEDVKKDEIKSNRSVKPGRKESREMNEDTANERKGVSKETKEQKDDLTSSRRSNDSIKSDKKSKQQGKSEVSGDNPSANFKGQKSTRSNFVDEIFKSSIRSNASYLASMAKEFEADTKDTDSNEQAPPKPVPRRDRIKDDADRLPDGDDIVTASSIPKRLNDNELGSQTSMRSGDNAPVPSPRKSVSSRLSEDEVPKPSPRVIRRESNSKGKSSTKSSSKLPDPKSLRDWGHYTSKGCFFYEEDEIVTHVYRLKMTMDSTVYISAHPIDEPGCLNLPGSEPVDTALFLFDDRGKLLHCSETRDIKGTYGIKCELEVGEYQIVPYTTGCRFKQRSADQQSSMKEAKLVKTVDDKVVITSKFRQALEDVFDLCDLDNNGTMSKDEFNWFNLRTSGEELGEDEWDVVEERTELQDGEITKEGFIALNEMEAEDAQGDVEDLWITLTSMGMNKALIMDEACPYRVDVYVEEQSRKKPVFKVTGIESLEKKEFVSEICSYTIEKAGDPARIKNMKDLYLYTYKTDQRATIVVDNRSRSNVNLEVDCSRSRNVISNRPGLDFTLDVDPQETAIAHHLMPRSELQDWSVSCTETIHK